MRRWPLHSHPTKGLLEQPEVNRIDQSFLVLQRTEPNSCRSMSSRERRHGLVAPSTNPPELNGACTTAHLCDHSSMRASMSISSQSGATPLTPNVDVACSKLPGRSSILKYSNSGARHLDRRDLIKRITLYM